MHPRLTLPSHFAHFLNKYTYLSVKKNKLNWFLRFFSLKWSLALYAKKKKSKELNSYGDLWWELKLSIRKLYILMTPCIVFHHYHNGFVHTAYICQHGQRAFWDLMLTNLGLSEDLPIQGLNCTTCTICCL